MGKNVLTCLTCGLVAALTSPSLLAQSEESNSLEEVTVTATKREQTLQEVPVAVSVISAETIDRAQINDVLDLSYSVASLRVSQLQSSGNTTFIIRGFGNGANNPGIEPSVGVFVDGVYRSRAAAALADLPNIERVEVLRGPQSTLFGKNASAGVINVVTGRPSMSDHNGSVSLSLGNYNQFILKGDVNGPISDTMGYGIAVTANQRDGYYTNLETGGELNERDRWSMRGQFTWDPTEDLSFRLIADTEEIDELCCAVANLQNGPAGVAINLVGGQLVANAPFAYENYYDFDPTNKIENSGISLQADWTFGPDILFTSITSYRELSRVDNADVDFTSARLVGFNSGDTQIDTFTQEFRFSQSMDNIDWMVGMMYFDEEVSYDNDIAYDDAFRPYADILSAGGVSQLENTMKALGLLPPAARFFDTGQGTTEFAGQQDDTISFFGQVDWNITDKLTLTGGLNYTSVEKSAYLNQVQTDIFSALDMVQVGFGAGFFGLTGLPPTPENIFNNPQDAAIAAQLSTIPCTPETGPACNQLLGFVPFQFLPPTPSFPNAVESGKTDDSDTTWTLRAAYQLTDNINVYASAATGFKASAWNLSRDSKPFASDVPALIAAGLNTPNMRAGTRYAGPEESTAYEIGLKGNWSTLSLYLALFDQEIDGFQSNIFTGTGFELANAGKQSTKGLEVDAMWQPSDSWQFTFSGAFLDPKYDSFEQGEGVDGPEDLSGTDVPGVHQVSMSTSATWFFELGSVDSFIRASYVYDDKVQVIENVPAEVASREVNMLNASFGMQFANGAEVLLWGRNLTDDTWLLSAFPSVAQNGSYSGYPNQPRTYGVTLKYVF